MSVWKERGNLVSSAGRGVSLMWSFHDCQIDANETLLPNESLRFAFFPVMVCNTTTNASLYSHCSCLSADHREITEEQRERNQKLAVAFVDETCNLHFDTAIKKFHRSEK